MSSLGHFLAAARTEVARYGDDDDVFVRELVQNARDAFARRISFSRKDEGDLEVVTVDDDGTGMSRAVVTGALLRLFSSKKDQEEGAAGCFGVGFWSVLRFADVDVVVDTSDGKEHSALRIDLVNETLVEETSRRAPGPGAPAQNPAQKGTQVTLRRRRRDAPFALRAALLAHACHVTGKRGAAPRLELLGADGRSEVLNRNLKLGDDVLCSRAIEGPGFRGVVGLSPSPRIELLHHGLRVVEASSLLALVPSKKTTPARGLGLSAQIDVDSLTVLVDRKTVVEDDRLRAVVDACDAAAKKLEREALDEAAPLPLKDAAVQAALRVLRSAALRVAVGAVVTLAVGAVCGFGLLWLLRPDLRDRIPVRSPWSVLASSSASSSGSSGSSASSSSAPSSASSPFSSLSSQAPQPARPLDHALRGFDAPRIDVRGTPSGGWDVDVDGVGTGQLRLFALPLPDDRKGLTTRPLRTRPSPPPPSAPTHARLALRVAAAGPLILPSSPTLWPIAVTDGGRRLPVHLVDDDGLPVFVAAAPGVLTVELTSTANVAPPSTVALPTPASSTALAALIAPALAADASLRKELIVAAVQDHVRYAADAASAAAFDRDRRPFIDKALALGRGDCDVINTVLVRALLAAGYEARLAVGLVVVDDNVAYDLHAWAEVRDDDGGFTTYDASPADARPKPVPTATTSRPTTAPPSTALPNRLFIAGIAAALALASLAVLLALVLQRRRRQRPRPHVLPLFLAGLQSGAADRLGLRRRPFLPTLDGRLLSLDDAARLFARGRLTRGGTRPAWLHPRVRVLDVDDERVRALRPWLPRLVDADEVVFDETQNAQGRLRPLQDAIDRVFAGVHVRAGDVDDVVELHLRTRTGATHLVLVSRALLGADDATLEARVRDATCLRGLPPRATAGP